jgi:hypothetical protein
MEEDDAMLTRQDNERGVATLLIYPYSSLPTLKSHLHPKFAIFSAGMKLRSLDDAELDKLHDEYSSLSKIIKLYTAWGRVISRKAKKDKSYIDPESR